MKEFNCEASSTWSACGRERDDDLTHGHSSPGMKKETSQQDYIIGLARRDDEMHIHNEERMWATWNHYHIFARRQEEGGRTNKKFQKGNEEEVDWMDDIVRRDVATAAGRWFATQKRKEKKLHNEHTRECQRT